FVDQTQTGVRDAHAHPTIFCFNPEAAVLQVGQKTALGFVVGVGNIVPNHGLLARDFTYACHKDTPRFLTAACKCLTHEFAPGLQLASPRHLWVAVAQLPYWLPFLGMTYRFQQSRKL